jgi:hypothetical protein
MGCFEFMLFLFFSQEGEKEAKRMEWIATKFKALQSIVFNPGLG